jgi:hypothetical protein
MRGCPPVGGTYILERRIDPRKLGCISAPERRRSSAIHASAAPRVGNPNIVCRAPLSLTTMMSKPCSVRGEIRYVTISLP